MRKNEQFIQALCVSQKKYKFLKYIFQILKYIFQNIINIFVTIAIMNMNILKWTFS